MASYTNGIATLSDLEVNVAGTYTVGAYALCPTDGWFSPARFKLTARSGGLGDPEVFRMKNAERQKKIHSSSAVLHSAIFILTSGEYFLHHSPMHVRQTVVPAAVAVGQFLVIQAHQMQNRRVQVVDVDLVLDGCPAELVG